MVKNTSSNEKYIRSLESLCELAPSGDGDGQYIGCCPAHDDSTPSLSVNLKDRNKPLVHCHAGCSQEEVMEVLKESKAWPEKREKKPVFGTFGSASKDSSLEKKEKVKFAQEMWSRGVSDHYLISKYYDYRSNNSFKQFFPKGKFKILKQKEKEIILLCKIENPKTHEIIGVNRIYLDKEGRNIKENGKNIKKVLGGYKYGGVLLYEKDESLEEIHIVEGVETALAIREVIQKPVFSALAANNVSSLVIPDGVKRIHYWADKDRSKTGEKVSREAANINSLEYDVYLYSPDLGFHVPMS